MPTLNRLKRIGREVDRGWPGYMFGGHVRTSTLALVLAFLAVWWLYDTYRPAPPSSSQVPATQVVPPGFLPDPNYTWVPRSRLQQPTATVTVTPKPTPTTTPPTKSTTTRETTTTSLPPPLIQLPTLPPLFGPPPTTPTSEPPESTPTPIVPPLP